MSAVSILPLHATYAYAVRSTSRIVGHKAVEPHLGALPRRWHRQRRHSAASQCHSRQHAPPCRRAPGIEIHLVIVRHRPMLRVALESHRQHTMVVHLGHSESHRRHLAATYQQRSVIHTPFRTGRRKTIAVEPHEEVALRHACRHRLPAQPNAQHLLHTRRLTRHGRQQPAGSLLTLGARVAHLHRMGTRAPASTPHVTDYRTDRATVTSIDSRNLFCHNKKDLRVDKKK